MGALHPVPEQRKNGTCGTYPQANITSIDCAPGASEVNQLNRIKLVLARAYKANRFAAEQSADGMAASAPIVG